MVPAASAEQISRATRKCKNSVRFCLSVPTDHCMKCLTHTSVDAVGICAYCGQALCLDCLSKPATKPLTCSPQCAEAVSRNEKALESILHQTLRSAQASAFYCYICAALSAGAAIVAWF